MAKIKKEFLDYFLDNNIHLPSRTYYLDGNVNQNMTSDIIKGLKILDEAENKPIHIIMNSEGGSLQDGFAIYDFIRNLRSYVTITVYGNAASSASIILQAADERILSQNSSVLLHFGSDGFGGDHVNFIRFAKESARARRLMEEIYLEKIHQAQPNFKRKQMKDLLTQDTYLSPEQVVALGLADRIAAPGEKTK